ncbi:thioredoxin domain-containing protein 15 [Tetranychus urticae]|uniref:thioredoxin domain-containing protein 15 n=1 Tax=Tetranychus urticae TaxID=32264 RepID=UPI00077BAC97|nr:thioredoxin domain-containing protein 15 [Tetranychus urticae]
MNLYRGTIKLNHYKYTLIFLKLFLTLSLVHHVSGETEEDIVSVEETIDSKPYDSSEVIDNNPGLHHSNDFGDTDSNQTSGELVSQAIGLIEEKRSTDSDIDTMINKTSANSTANDTKVECTLVNMTDSEVSGVEIVNAKRFLELVTPKGNESTCVLALFYYPWCAFSAKSSRDFNAIGKLFPQLNVIALNAYLHNSINMRFGLVGIPTVLFFHNGKIVAKYNSTESSLLSMVSFIYRLTGLEPDLTVNLTEDDWTSPLPTIPQVTIDYVLILSSVFLLFTVCYLIGRSSIFAKIIESIRNTWREAEAQHQHLD